MKEKKLYNIAFMGDKDHGCDIISTLESWGGSNYYLRTGSDPEYAYFINDLGTIDFIHNSALLSEVMKNFYFLFWHDYNIECQLKVGESINYGGQDYDVDSILFDANNRCIVYKLKSFGIGVEYITNNELIPVEEFPTEEENNMKRKLAIKGHPTRGKEVIKLLEMMGGNTFNSCMKIAYSNRVYYIGNNNAITWDYIGPEEIDKYEIFTLEEFLEKYPFKIGDKVFDIIDGDPGIIRTMKWDEDVSDMKYNVVFDNGDMGWYTNDTIEFFKINKNETLEETQSNQNNDKVVNNLRNMKDLKESITPSPDITAKVIDKNNCDIKCPDGYEFYDENGNLIGTKVMMRPKKPKYPKTYVECCKVLGISYRKQLSYTNTDVERGNIYLTKEKHLLDVFMNLRICRNAYWKIAGEEMGLDNSWESPLPSLFETVHCIRRKNNKIIKGSYRGGKSEILEFPTEEMRDAFYENFKDLIEQCKELL